MVLFMTTDQHRVTSHPSAVVSCLLPTATYDQSATSPFVADHIFRRPSSSFVSLHRRRRFRHLCTTSSYCTVYILSSVFVFPAPVRRVPTEHSGTCTVVPVAVVSTRLESRQRHRRSFHGVRISGWSRGHYHIFGTRPAVADTGLRKPGERSTWVEVETSRPAVTSVISSDGNYFPFPVRVLYTTTTSAIRLDDCLQHDVTRTHVVRFSVPYVVNTL